MLRFFDDGAGGGRRQRLTRLAFIWGVWTLVGLFFSSQIYVYYARTDRPVPVGRALAWQMSAVFLFALSTPLVVWLSRRYPLERTNWRRHVPIHLLACVAVSAAWSAGHIVLDFYFSSGMTRFRLANLPRLIFAMIDKEMLVYCIILLSTHAFDYYQRYREGELRASQAQLQALKMQLHPHFLFNALHSISALVHKDPDSADRMIARLGDFLRMTLDSSAAQEVTLRRELEFLDCYLEIERIRFQDRLTTRLDVDPRLLECRVPNLILQPIVENAIRHGVSQRSTPGRVEISAARAGQWLRLQVRDNGAGLPAGAQARGTRPGGVGIPNTSARLSRLYGAAYRFEIEDDPRGGVVVTLEIPMRGADSSEDAEAAHAPATVDATATTNANARESEKPRAVPTRARA